MSDAEYDAMSSAYAKVYAGALRFKRLVHPGDTVWRHAVDLLEQAAPGVRFADAEAFEAWCQLVALIYKQKETVG